jgi:hypothetical protein
MYNILTVNRKLNCQAPRAFGGSGGAMGEGRATKRGGGRVRDNFIAQIFVLYYIVYLNLLSFFAQSCCSACQVVESAASCLHSQYENAWHHHQGPSNPHKPFEFFF